MNRADRTKRVDPVQADRYAEVGRRLVRAGRDLDTLGDPSHASALAILAVHAVIAFADAVAIHLVGAKSTSADHRAAISHLRVAVGTRIPDRVLKDAERTVAEKDRFEYSGYVATLRDARSALDRAERVAAWAEQLLITIPRTGP
ncbi:MAG: hypothetical protein SFW08_13160 [Gemmatimonadaceae bacterium]|nr:hypothetical protein [Gemmatimonadaceae bacterium]